MMLLWRATVFFLLCRGAKRSRWMRTAAARYFVRHEEFFRACDIDMDARAVLRARRAAE